MDKEADALYLRLSDASIVESEEVAPGVVLDFSDDGEVVGVEMLHLSKRVSPIDVGRFVLETGGLIAATSAREDPASYGKPKT
jgi:uncharacterized protein YuzE